MAKAKKTDHYENLELFSKNKAFMAKSMTNLVKAFDEMKPKYQIVNFADGDINLYDGQHFFYTKGAKADAKDQIQAFKRKPSRIVFGKPSMFAERPEGALIPDHNLASREFLTTVYDDKNSDDHTERFYKVCGPLLKDKGFEIGDSITSPNPYFLVIYGVGLGQHLNEIDDLCKPSVLIVLESDPELMMHSMHTFDWEAFHQKLKKDGRRLRLVLETDGIKLNSGITSSIHSECLLGLDGVMSFKHYSSPALDLAYSEFNNEKTSNIAAFIGFTVDEYNMMKNSFRNLRSGTKRVLNVLRKKADVPVIITGSGPSLEENIEFIRENQDRAVIISSGSSMPVLLKNGIKPDFQAVLERAKAVYDRHTEAAEKFDLKDTYVVLTSTIWPGIDNFFKGVIYFFRPALSPLGIFANRNEEILNFEGPQVTNTAFAFARRLHFSEFYLVGLDLGAADPSKPRAEKAWISPGVKQRNLDIPVRGNFGRTVFTDKALIQQRMTIENQIRNLSGGPVYNLSNGVRIGGAEPKPAKEILLPKLTIDKKKLVDELYSQFPVFSRERFISQWESSQIRELIASYCKGIEDALNKNDTWNHKLMAQIDAINQYANKPLRLQFAPRLFRGSVLRMFMYINSVMLRLKDQSKSTETYDLLRAEFLKMLKSMEYEAYSLVDELESEDDYFKVKLN